MTTGRVNIVLWVLRLITWDSLLPLFVFLLPLAIGFLFPDRRGAIEATAVVLPIVAFFVRLCAGMRQIASNNCGASLQRIQVLVFFLAIFVLALIDCVLILSHIMPRGAAFATKNDRVVWAILFSVYLASMAIAMYPGSSDPAEDTRLPGYDDPEWGE